MVKEVMRISVIDTTIFKTHSIRVASNSAAYGLGMTLQEIFKKVKGQILLHSLTPYTNTFVCVSGNQKC